MMESGEGTDENMVLIVNKIVNGHHAFLDEFFASWSILKRAILPCPASAEECEWEGDF